MRLVVLVHAARGRRRRRGRRVRRPHAGPRRRHDERVDTGPAARALSAAPGAGARGPTRGGPGRASARHARRGRLLCVGAVVPHKGHDLLLDALGGIASLPWHCTVVGPLDRSPPFVERLRRQAADAGLADRICFAGPRTGEGWAGTTGPRTCSSCRRVSGRRGMVVTEALAVRLPVVATAVGGVPEALGQTSDGPPGLLVPPGGGRPRRRARRLAGRRGAAGAAAYGSAGTTAGVGGLGATARRGRGAGRGERRVMSSRTWAWARPLGGAAILGVLVWRLGTGPSSMGCG